MQQGTRRGSSTQDGKVNDPAWPEGGRVQGDEPGCRIRSQIPKRFVYCVKQLGVCPKGSADWPRDFKHQDNVINKG